MQRFQRQRRIYIGIGSCLLALMLFFVSMPTSAQTDTAPDGSATPTPEENPPGILIVGGVEAEPGAWPWQVDFRYEGSHSCGGSLLSPEWVVTASHCVEGRSASLMTVVLGDHNINVNEGAEQTFRVASVTMHPRFNRPKGFSNDIAVLRLRGQAELNSRVQTIEMVTSPQDNALFSPGTPATVTGWGRTSEQGARPSRLRQVTVPIVSNQECAKSYGNRLDANTMLCAGLPEGGKDSCQGDSGGPLVVADGSTWRLAGIVSWGDGCARPNAYGVYSRVGVLSDWVRSVTGLQPAPTTTPSSTATQVVPTPTTTGVVPTTTRVVPSPTTTGVVPTTTWVVPSPSTTGVVPTITATATPVPPQTVTFPIIDGWDNTTKRPLAADGTLALLTNSDNQRWSIAAGSFATFQFNPQLRPNATIQSVVLVIEHYEDPNFRTNRLIWQVGGGDVQAPAVAGSFSPDLLLGQTREAAVQWDVTRWMQDANAVNDLKLQIRNDDPTTRQTWLNQITLIVTYTGGQQQVFVPMLTR